MAIRFASASQVSAEKLSTAQNLSNVNLLKKEAVLKKEAHATAEKIGAESSVLKISADQIIENTVKLWMNHGK